MQKQPNFAPPIPSPQYSGFIIIQLVAGLGMPEVDNLLDFTRQKKQLKPLADQLKDWGFPKTTRAITSLPPKQILALEERATARRKQKPPQLQKARKPLPSLTRYWRLDARQAAGKADEWVRTLINLAEVDFAYRELKAADPGPVGPFVNPVDDDLSPRQGYLNPATQGGIDAKYAWQFTKGAAVTFADLEAGWYTQHEDLQALAPLVFGNNWVAGDDHGTSVLGIVLGNDNAFGIVGIAPGVTSVKLTSRYLAATNSAEEVANALTAVLPSLVAGDVLLLEVQRNLKPTELDLLDFNAISLATDLDVIVIEPAGNGDHNLDALSASEIINGVARLRSLNRTSPNFLDSGALLVGACQQKAFTKRFGKSNYGSRVDCYAWGEEVVTTSTKNNNLHSGPQQDPKSRYASRFGGTSAAAAILAGAALLLQSRYQTVYEGQRLLNFEEPLRNLRTILAAPGNGTLATDAIGVMPDLKKIFAALALD